jgi:hypothetical protein
MHKEHLYEYFRYIRRNTGLLNELQELAKAILHEEPLKKQIVLVDRLIAIKTRSDFVSSIFLLTYIIVLSFFRATSNTNLNNETIFL